ncbi:hypothetical protein VRRI112168_00455 [Vreelandella rituensis]|uniref:Uncharacterized protein n=1 Tax=Vreelandella rituensis TaxID=2282306 RepID=A0A368UBQ0_9GAMM|nr:hypothetical protein [Halomonas rituensis]RCV93832.1 hypothetical protein DU506_01355 [Halomonas rituensis]
MTTDAQKPHAIEPFSDQQASNDVPVTDLTHDKDLYVVYPIHIEQFMERFQLRALEMSNLLGFPSVQEWYKVHKNPHERIRNTNVCNLLRAYTEHPEWLKSTQFSFAKVTERIQKVLASHGYEKQHEVDYFICQVFDKSQSVLGNWVTGTTAPDQASQRVSELIMELNDDDLFEFISDARLATIPQVLGRDVTVYHTKSGERRYSAQGTDDLYTLAEIARASPLPGARRSAKDYPPALSEPRTTVIEGSATQETHETEVAKKHTKGLPWIQSAASKT